MSGLTAADSLEPGFRRESSSRTCPTSTLTCPLRHFPHADSCFARARPVATGLLPFFFRFRGIEPETPRKLRRHGRIVVIVDIRIPDIIHVNPVDVVFRDDLFYDRQQVGPDFGIAGRKVPPLHGTSDQIDPVQRYAPEVDPVRRMHEPFWMLQKYVPRRLRAALCRVPGEVDVHPGVHFQPRPVPLLHEKRKRVEIRLGQSFGARHQSAGVEGVSSTPDLHQKGVHPPLHGDAHRSHDLLPTLQPVANHPQSAEFVIRSACPANGSRPQA